MMTVRRADNVSNKGTTTSATRLYTTQKHCTVIYWSYRIGHWTPGIFKILIFY